MNSIVHITEYGMNAMPLSIYRQKAYLFRRKSQHLNVSRLVLQLSLPYPLKAGVESRMKM